MTLFTKFYLGFLAGFSVGTTYLGLSLPVFLPLLLSKKQSAKGSFFLILEFFVGRLLGYLFFGLVFGFLGQVIKSDFIHIIFSLATLWLGILMIVYSLGSIDKKICAALPFSKIKWSFLLGFLTGVNIYPPFLASLTYVFNLKDAVLSLFYFLAFFLGTSVYLIPAAFFGIFTKINWLTKIAQVSGVIVGIYFIVNTLFSAGILPQNQLPKKPANRPTSKQTKQQTKISPTNWPSPTNFSKSTQEFFKVGRVIDGDTIVLENGKIVRYIGIDAPELHHPKKKVECFAKEAKEANEKLVLNKTVRLEKDLSETDKYGRLLRYVYVDNPSTSLGEMIFVNEYLVKEGFALLATFPPDVKYQNLFQKAQKNAQENNKGLWNKKVCQL